MPSSSIIFEQVRSKTYSHAPPSAYFDVSDLQLGAQAVQDTIPYQMPDPAFNQTDPLSGFLAQSDRRPIKTEAERIGADRFGETWPMIRSQRLHSGDSHVMEAGMRRIYANSRIGQIFTPLEMPQDPDILYRSHDPSGRKHKDY